MHRSPHPLAWWAWAAALGVAATRLTDARTLVALLVAVVLVVLARRDASPWGRSFRGYLVLGACIVVVRVLFHVIVGIKGAGPVLLDLPRVPLPDWAAGIQLLGPVTTSGLSIAATDGLRLGVLVVCVGAANALANPRRALRALPASLHHLGTAVVIAVSVTPQLVDAAAAVRRAQRLRGVAPRGARAVRAVVLPVLTDALDRSLALAASMDSRGYARTVSGRPSRWVGALLLVALVAATLGVYGLLGGSSAPLAAALLVVGTGAATAASLVAGRQVRRTRYRPDRWSPDDAALVASGVLGATALATGGTGPLPFLGALVAALPALSALLRPRAERVPGRPAMVAS